MGKFVMVDCFMEMGMYYGIVCYSRLYKCRQSLTTVVEYVCMYCVLCKDPTSHEARIFLGDKYRLRSRHNVRGNREYHSNRKRKAAPRQEQNGPNANPHVNADRNMVRRLPVQPFPNPLGLRRGRGRGGNKVNAECWMLNDER